jgi:transcriptional regulator GlxA family with amidase domain
MKRRDLLQLTAALSVAASTPRAALAEATKGAKPSAAQGLASSPLRPPADGRIPVAFLLSNDAVMIDFAGPWEVFDNVRVPGPIPHPFQLYTVAETTAPVRISGSMTVVPTYSLLTAPPPKVIVIPAQSEPTEAVIAWIKSATKSTDVTMSVCTGAFFLAKTGLLAGKEATTHHGAYAQFSMAYPDVILKRGARFVESGNLASSGGLSSGIDLALHVVERYFGREIALRTTDNLEYQGLGWQDANSNRAYAKSRVSTEEHSVCPVCQMDAERVDSLRSVYRSHVYYCCMDSHKKLFDSAPDRFINS